jgi:hypothetical protein
MSPTMSRHRRGLDDLIGRLGDLDRILARRCVDGDVGDAPAAHAKLSGGGLR